MIDYIFRELAMSYLGRYDLVQVKPEDLRGDTVGNPRKEDVEFTDEEEMNDEVGTFIPGAAHVEHGSRGFSSVNPNTPTQPVAADDQATLFEGKNTGSPAWNLEQTQRSGAPQPSGRGPSPTPITQNPIPGRAAVATQAVQAPSAGTASLAEKVRIARLKGYEGDPCSNCGAFTLVRNGVCVKCESCGETSGCS